MRGDILSEALAMTVTAGEHRENEQLAATLAGIRRGAGTEVVIERIEDDIAYVEAWMEVEKRL